MKIIYKITLVLLVVLISSKQSYSKEKINISLGAGFMELINIGFNRQYEQTNIGVSCGFIPNKNMFAIKGDLGFHFGDISRYSKIKLWYYQFGLLFIYNEDSINIERSIHSVLRIGRNIYISEKLGFDLNLGISGRLMENGTSKNKLYRGNRDIDLPILPNLGIRLFYVF